MKAWLKVVCQILAQQFAYFLLILCLHTVCEMRLIFCEKADSQYEHLNGFSPVWILMWTSIFCRRVKRFWQTGQECGFSLVCLCMIWDFKWDFLLVVYEQNEQRKRRSKSKEELIFTTDGCVPGDSSDLILGCSSDLQFCESIWRKEVNHGQHRIL